MKGKAKWYVAQVLTGSEEETARQLTAAGMEAIAPAEVLYERRHGKWRLIRRMVFPGYVFIRAELKPRTYYNIQRQPRVIRLLGGGTPEPVPEEQMAAVLLFSPDGRDFGISQGTRTEAGTVVTSGPLTALEDRIVSINARARRASVEIDVLGRTHRVEAGILVSRASTQQSDDPA